MVPFLFPNMRFVFFSEDISRAFHYVAIINFFGICCGINSQQYFFNEVSGIHIFFLLYRMFDIVNLTSNDKELVPQITL